MPLTYCRMRVNLNEKCIIHIPTEPQRVAAMPGCLTHAQKGKERQSPPTQFIISFIDFPSFGGGVGMSGNFIVPRICFLRFQNKLCVASQKPDLVSQCFSTFSFKRMRLNNNEEERMMARSEI